MKSRTAVLHSLQTKIRLRHLAHSTEQAYCGWVGRYYDFCLSLPKAWPPERKAEAFLSHLAVKGGVAARTQNQALSALLFLYDDVMGERWATLMHCARNGRSTSAPRRRGSRYGRCETP